MWEQERGSIVVNVQTIFAKKKNGKMPPVCGSVNSVRSKPTIHDITLLLYVFHDKLQER